MSQKFTHLHVHSHYSLLDGLPKIDLLLDRVKELGMDSVALTDHGNMYGAIEFYKAAKERGIKPILGGEMYIALDAASQKRPGIDDTSHHLILLVKNEQGYRNLVKLLTKAYLEGFYYKPRIDETWLQEYSSGLIALSSCLTGKIPRLILAKKLQEAENAALRYQEIFGKDNFYLELQDHPNIREQKVVNEGLIALAKKTGIPLVATADSHYLRPEDADAQDILMLINTGARPDDPERITLKSDDFSLKSPADMEKLFQDVPEALENTQKISEMCNFTIALGVNKLPVYPLPPGKTAEEYLRELCLLGLEKRLELKDSKEAKERLEYELDVIQKTGFAAYFLIVQDFVNWAKEHRIVVGPGRGSVGGSLAAYLLGITNINPLKYNLLFERFLNPERISLPDIDLDFADYRRDEVITYVGEKYGHDKVAQIITFGTMASRAVVRDVGRALAYEYLYCDRLAKMIPFGMTLEESLTVVEEFKELYNSDERAKRLIDLAKKLEGVVRHASTHACGVVIAPEPLENLVPVQHPTQGEEHIVTQYEMHSIEDLGLLKMDFLGLKNLTIIEDTLKRIYAIHGKNINLDSIPFDDDKVYELFRVANTVGVFQVESEGMRRYLKELKPTEFEDIVAMIALYRPGPMELIPEYIARKHGKKKVEYLHPKLKPILEKTQGICIYQEELMQIARDIAGFTMGEADVLRKAVGKKIEKLLLEQKEKFIQGAVKNQIAKNIAEKLWEWILPFAHYGFNKSHSASYAMITYQTAWLKTYYPLEFMSALLTSERNDIERIAFLIDETRKMGIEVLPPDINESFSYFSVVLKDSKIRFGLLAIKNVGEGIVEVLIKERKEQGPYTSISDVVSRVHSKDLNKKSFESLVKAGVFDRFGERNQFLKNMEKLLEIARENNKINAGSQKSLFGSQEGLNNGIKLEPAPPAKEKELLLWEKELLGLYVSSHPLAHMKNFLEQKTISITKVLNASPESPGLQKRMRIGGIISSMKKILTRVGKPMLFIRLEDLTDNIEVVAFPTVMEKNPGAFQENKIVFVEGRVDTRNGERKFIADAVEEIVE
ncbi:MAG: DNA polymerase III subunit alpha [Parcubacteria group bacterium Greene0714_21]|nr:MAG: DNA polymerase III subunit alpha [Parcubacteria group bacterium Greene0416_39]TSC98550.1 MAG: DNA polymerase III subunit alpha [Parcubacteria group bacterium Greene1014_47]TSD04311.1 MAG: DNA polymerase III subunit alpha [Parcubacteria group bacterium Greene0714_21]